MPSRIDYLSVTFREDVFLGGIAYTAGMTASLPGDVARGLGSTVTLNGPGSSATSPRPSVGSALRQQSAAHRMFGLTGVTTYSQSRTFCVKMEAESAFDSVRMHYCHHETALATGFSALVAATETASVATVALAGQPTVGGVKTAALRAAVGAPGWAQVTFAGASSADVAAAASTYNPAFLSSDWIELPSVTRADGGTRPLLMARIFHDGAANGSWNLVGGFTADTDTQKTAWQNASAFPWWREYQCLTITTDAVTTPATDVPAAALQGSSVWLGFEFGYRNKALSVLQVGDSLAEGAYGMFGGWGSWGLRGCNLASSPSRPITFIQNGVSGQTSSTYNTAAEAAIALFKPTNVLLEGLSPNDQAAVSALTANELQAAYTRLQRVARACRSAGARLAVVTPFPNSAYNAASDANRLALRAAILTAGATGAYDVLDVESVLGDGATPVRYKLGYAYDTTHPNNAAADPLSFMVRDYLAAQ